MNCDEPSVTMRGLGKDLFEVSYLRMFWAFAVSFGVLGACLTFGQPVFSLPDEAMHWDAGHARLERLMGHEGCVPTVPPNEGYSQRLPGGPPLPSLPAPRMRCIKEWAVYGDALTYPGMVLSKLILPRQTDSAIRQIQGITLTRLLQGLLVGLCLLRLGVLARRTGRSGVLLVAAFCMSPLLAQQAFAVSADSAQLCFAICLCTTVLYWESLTWTDVLMFAVFGWSATSRPFILTCVIPAVLAGFWYAQLRANEGTTVGGVLRALWQALRPTRRLSQQKLILWIAAVLTVLTVVFAARGPRFNPEETVLARGRAGVDARQQALRLVTRPETLFQLVDGLIPFPRSLKSYVGPLGQLDAEIPPAIENKYQLMLLFATLLELMMLTRSARTWRWEGPKRFLIRLRTVLLPLSVGVLGAIANVFVVTAILYIVWTPYALPVADGVQTRYFFASTIVMIAVVLGGLSVVFATPAVDLKEPPVLPSSAKAARIATVLGVLAPIVVMTLTLPYVARVFIDLAMRYG